MINWRNIKIIRFPDKSYAVRKGWMTHKYFDFYMKGLWWYKDSVHMSDCKTLDYDLVEQCYKEALGEIEVIK